jgi:hypothetical protein
MCGILGCNYDMVGPHPGEPPVNIHSGTGKKELHEKNIRSNKGKTEYCRKVATGFIPDAGSDKGYVIHCPVHEKPVS